MTKTEKKWKFLPQISGQDYAVPDWLFSILASRGVKTKKEIEAYLNPKYEYLRDPEDFLNINKAVERITIAKEKKEKVVIYGDYDVDGICATAIVFETLNKIGVQNIETYIPHREEEGYGLNEKALAEIKEKGANLIISVDCGITSRELVDSSEIDFIVCDHHEISEEKLPKKAIILHPQMVKGEKESLCGAGVALFLALALQKKFPKELAPGQEKWLLDLAALATICDVVPLAGQNRIIAKWGIIVLSKTKRVGLLALMELAGINSEEVTAYTVGFVIGPRLNAAGRLEHAKKALELILTKDEKSARQIAKELNTLNIERQKLCERILEEAKAKIETQKDEENEILLLADKNWPRGVVGIIASRLSDSYNLPVIVFEDDGEVCHGSARSVEGLDITSVLSEISDILVKFGGHAKAAGLTVKTEHFNEFAEKISSKLKGKIKKEVLSELTIDATLKAEDISEETMEYLLAMEPFGFGNKTPVFALLDAELENIKKVGGNGEHLKFSIKGLSGVGGIFFSAPEEIAKKVDGACDLAFTMKYNVWNNRKTIDLRVLDIKVSKMAVGNV